MDNSGTAAGLDPGQTLLLQRYSAAVVECSKRMNLTGAKTAAEFMARHVADALAMLASASLPGGESLRCLDVGSGNGVPGIPLAVVRPAWSLSLLDSNRKRCGFLESFCNSAPIANARVVCGNAEALAHGPLRESFDIVFSRALAKLATALELAGGFARIGGRLIVSHGTSWEDQVRTSQGAANKMGLQYAQSVAFRVGVADFQALLFEKVRQTPDPYPRAVGVPAKKPL